MEKGRRNFENLFFAALCWFDLKISASKTKDGRVRRYRCGITDERGYPVLSTYNVILSLLPMTEARDGKVDRNDKRIFRVALLNEHFGKHCKTKPKLRPRSTRKLIIKLRRASPHDTYETDRHCILLKVQRKDKPFYI